MKKVFEVIGTELNYVAYKEDEGQDHIVRDFPLSAGLQAIEHNLGKAKTSWYEGKAPHPEAMTYLRKIAAICVKMGIKYEMPRRIHLLTDNEVERHYEMCGNNYKSFTRQGESFLEYYRDKYPENYKQLKAIHDDKS